MPNEQVPLRKIAEVRLASTPQRLDRTRPAEELLHELQVHQIELEMQNEELRVSRIALEESRDRYMDLYEFAPVAFLTITREGMIAEVNFSATTLLGVERKKFYKRRFTGFVASEDKDRWYRHFLNVVQHEGCQSCELALLRGDGSQIYARLDCQRMEAGDGYSMRIALTDITEQQQAENKLRKSQEQLRAFIQHSPVSIAMFDRDMNYLAISDQWKVDFGRDNSDFIGRNHYELFPDLPIKWKAVHQQGLAGLILKNNEDLWIKNDGSEHWLRWSVQPWLDMEAKIGGIIIAAEDITELKRTEEELRIAAISFESQEGMMVTDTKGVIMRVNQAFTRLTGYSAEEAIGNTPAMLHSGFQDQRFYKRMWNTLKKDRYWQGEIWNKRKDGKIFAEWLNISAAIAPDGSTTHYIGAFFDISRLKSLENELRESHESLRDLAGKTEQLREEERKRVAREVHDELGQLLMALRMDIWRAGVLPGEHDGIRKKVTENLLAQVDKVIRGVRDVIANLRPPALDMGLVAAIGWLKDEFFARTATECVLHVAGEQVELGEDPVVVVFRIVQESLTNIARHAAASHVEITISFGEDVKVEVRDNGIGFDVSAIPAKKTFGLMGMKERAHAVRGHVEITSEPLQGTIVSVRIPLKSQGNIL